MTSAQQLRLVAVLSALTLAAYFPAAWYLQRSYVSIMAPAPPGAVRQIFNLQKLTAEGAGWLEKVVGYRRQPDLLIYEDSRPLREVTSIEEVDKSGGGTFTQEDGVGIALSATDNRDPRSNNRRYWQVRRDVQQ
jgi:hypothetical protein